VVDGHAARDCDRSVSLPRRRYSDHDGDRYGRRRARVTFALARLWLPLDATRAASPAARTTVPAAYMHTHRRAASGSAWKLSAMNAHSSETEFAADSPLEGTGFEPSVPLPQKALLGVLTTQRFSLTRRSCSDISARTWMRRYRVGRDLLTQLIDALTAQGVIIPETPSLTAMMLPGRPH
jgi:hypothetical protein